MSKSNTQLHYTAVKEEQGFSAVEILLAIIAVSLVVFVGYFVWHAQQETNKTLQTATHETKVSTPSTTKPATIKQQFGMIYEAPTGHYTIQLQDGWNFTRIEKSDFMSISSNAALAKVAGRAATITDAQGGKDSSAEGLIINYTSDSTNYTVKDYTLVKTFKTETGQTVNEYTRTQVGDPMGPGGLDNGGTYYRYTVQGPKNSLSAVIVDYGKNPGQTDYRDLIEQSIESVTIAK